MIISSAWRVSKQFIWYFNPPVTKANCFTSISVKKIGMYLLIQWKNATALQVSLLHFKSAVQRECFLTAPAQLLSCFAMPFLINCK